MFGIGIPELVVIAVVALIVVGPKNLPVTLRAVGRAIREFQRASKELRREAGFDEVVDEVTRPLREGLAGIESEVMNQAPDFSLEYPQGGPDDYGALPEYAPVYEAASPYHVAKSAKQRPPVTPSEPGLKGGSPVVEDDEPPPEGMKVLSPVVDEESPPEGAEHLARKPFAPENAGEGASVNAPESAPVIAPARPEDDAHG